MDRKLALACVVLSVVVANFSWKTAAGIILIGACFMFSDTVKGGIDYAGASLKSMFGKVRGMGLSSFSEDELTVSEKQNNIQSFRGTMVGGIYNEGNTCFINSVVQSLASCDTMATFTARDEGNFSSELHKLIHDVNRIKKNNHNYSTARLMANIGGQQRWSRLDQEDAQEFFQQLLVALEKDKKTEKDGEKKDKLAKITPFDGEFAMRVGCLRCGDMEGIRRGVLSSVDLSLDSAQSSYQLQDLLKEYCHMETISEVECYRCTLKDWRLKLEEKAKQMPVMKEALDGRIAEIDDVLASKVIDEKKYAALKTKEEKSLGEKTKQTMFARPMADVLMIHINRSCFDMYTGFTRKNFAPVKFPAMLNMADYIVDPEDATNQDPAHPMHGCADPEWYVLKAAVVHYGSANFGHYVCFRKFNEFWWRISDDQVDLTTEAQVLDSQGVFMLFYEREEGVAKKTLPPQKEETPDVSESRHHI